MAANPNFSPPDSHTVLPPRRDRGECPMVVCLVEHQNKILELWNTRLFHCGRWPMDVERPAFLKDLFHEILGLVRGGAAMLPLLPPYRTPLNAARSVVNLLLVGEEIFAEVLKEHLKIHVREWLPMRRRLTLAFHVALRTNSFNLCEACHRTAGETYADSLKEIRRINSAIEELQRPHQGDGNRLRRQTARRKPDE